MTKEEKIKEAWDNKDGSNKEVWAGYWNYNKAKEHGMDKDGWIKVCGYEPGEGMVCDYMRPPQLEGIENNNGWIKIESEDDLPKENIECFYIPKHSKNIVVGSFRLSSYKGWKNMIVKRVLTMKKMMNLKLQRTSIIK